MDNRIKILILNGPNLGNLGHREPLIYGNTTFEDYLNSLKEEYTLVDFIYFQSNIEGEMINKLYEAETLNYDGVVLNAGGYTHTSVALLDTISTISTKVVEVHISSIISREDYRQKSLIAPKCIGSIMGFGLLSYSLGVKALLNKK